MVINKLFGNVTNKKIAILGFSFKADTNDTRESPAILICKELLNEGAFLSIHDPKVSASQIEFELGEVGKENRSNWSSSRELDDLWTGVNAGIMVFPDQRFEWWFWSNKMMVMRSLQIPIHGFLKGNSKEVFQLFPSQKKYFKEHGLVQLGADETPKPLASVYIQSWNDFTKKMLRN